MERSRRQRLTAAICLVALLGATAPAAAQWSLPRLGGGAPLDQQAISSGLVIVVVWTTWSPRGGNIVERINESDCDIVYTDEDFIRVDGRLDFPHFKPDYSPDLCSTYFYPMWIP